MTTGLLLAGPPGVGKTTVARATAQRLGLPFIDLDELVEARARRSPAQILEQDGEERFRALEVEALEALGPAAMVIALGGGALTTARARQVARQLGIIVRLDAERTLLERRLESSKTARPLLGPGLDALLDARRRTYAAVDVAVDGSGTPEDVAARVEAAVQELSIIMSRFIEEETRVVVGRGLETTVMGAVAHLDPTRPVLLIRDRGVPATYRERLEALIADHYPVHVVDLEGGEGVKTWGVLGNVLESALQRGCGRQSVVVGVGGGALCDLANLAAHLLGRGARSVLVPSTLLSQVDASVGGKCAINHGGQRNPVGAFQAPAEVVADLNLLETLDPAEVRSGLAEVVKIAIIGDPDLFERLEAGESPGPALIARAITLKSRVVARDPYERGERRTLNLGHTLGHALEAASGFTLRHGEAVAMGLAASARASARLGLLDPEVAARIEALLERLELPTRAEPTLLDAATAHLEADKKGDSQTVEWIAIQRLGEVSMERVTWAELKKTLVELGG